MIPDNCALAVRDGVVCVVGRVGDSRSAQEETGIYANDTQYLREFSIRATDRAAPETGWERLERQAGPDGITTVLIGAAPGEGRGAARRFLLKKDVSIERDTVTIETLLRNYTVDERVVDIELTAESAFRHIFECPGFFSARTPVEREVTATDRESGARLSGTVPNETTHRATVELDNAETVTTEDDGEIARTTATRTLQIPPGESTSVVATVTVQPVRSEVEVTVNPAVSTGAYPGLFEAATDTLRALLLPEGVPAAGAPRFIAPFGRDALLVGFHTLPFAPELTRSTLTYFAGQQSTTTDQNTLAERGKIPHENRHGDLPALGRSIRSPYYGTVDAAPLFAGLVAAYGEWAGDDAITDELYNSALDAIEWILSTADENGLLWYRPHDHEHGLTHQGWKDSAHAIAHPDGTAATPPIALAEVQGYVYRALRGISALATKRGDEDVANRLIERAAGLRTAFDTAFWLPAEGCYALALDADGMVESVASNQGHSLWSGIVPLDRADDVIDRLLEPDLLTDAGLRTYAASHKGFDPLSYHRGSVWPHDTSLAAMGCASYGRDDAVAALVNRGLDVLASSVTSNPGRWGFPELLVGFDDPNIDAGRVHHPDSCEPAAWCASSAFGFAQAALGVDVEEGEPVVDPVAQVDATVTASLYCRGTRYTVEHEDGSIGVTNATTSSSRDVPSTDHCSPEVISNG